MLPIALAVSTALAAAATADESRPVYSDRQTDPAMLKVAAEMRDAGKLLTSEVLLPQLKNPKCKLALPPVRTQKLAGREIWAAARRSYLRVGWYYQCSKCDRWHLDLAGGYAITADGAVATCYHVAETPAKFVRGHMVAATDDGRVFPVIAIIAANAKSDACIIRVKSDIPLTPMPLSDAAYPGDTVYCFSDPMGFRGYFSQGMVNRYYRESPRKGNSKNSGKSELQPLSLNVSTDWAPGSSGAAIIDECGNAIGHVARIMPLEESPRKKSADGTREDTGTLMVLHNAVPAQEVLALIERQ
jgi:Trypsin-like peptidase domain